MRKRLAFYLGLSIAIHGAIFLAVYFKFHLKFSGQPSISDRISLIFMEGGGGLGEGGDTQGGEALKNPRGPLPKREIKDSSSAKKNSPESLSSTPDSPFGKSGASDSPFRKGGEGGFESSVGAGGHGPGDDPGGAGSVLAVIQKKVDAAKHYPALAIKRGIEGRVKVQFTISSEGTPKSISVVQSSGAPILDQEALATVLRAAPLPYYPNRIMIPIVFLLQEVH